MPTRPPCSRARRAAPAASTMISVATMTLARTAEEAEPLLAGLEALTACGFPVLVADGGSCTDLLQGLGRLVDVEMVPPDGPGLVGQVRASLRAARDAGCDRILYTEPDKAAFFVRSLADFAGTATDRNPDGVTIAARDEAGFATFPETQRRTEGTINDLFGREVGLSGDFCYGPLVFPPDLVPVLDGLDPSIGWGWRFAVMGRAARTGLPLQFHTGTFSCPADQREDGPRDRAHRMRQLAENLRGTLVGLAEAP